MDAFALVGICIHFVTFQGQNETNAYCCCSFCLLLGGLLAYCMVGDTGTVGTDSDEGGLRRLLFFMFVKLVGCRDIYEFLIHRFMPPVRKSLFEIFLFFFVAVTCLRLLFVCSCSSLCCQKRLCLRVLVKALS